MTIEEMRKKKREYGLSYEIIAEKSGVPLSTVQKVFGGITTYPRFDTVSALEKLFASLKAEHEGVNLANGASGAASDTPNISDANGTSGAASDITDTANAKPKSGSDLYFVILKDDANKDIKTLCAKYKEKGVKELWIIDPEQLTVYSCNLSAEKTTMEIHSFDEDIPMALFNSKLNINISGLIY